MFIVDSTRIELRLHFKENLLDVVRKGMLLERGACAVVFILFDHCRRCLRCLLSDGQLHFRVRAMPMDVTIGILASTDRSSRWRRRE